MTNDTVVKSNMWKALAYIAGCGAIAYAVKVTKSATPLWALLLLSAPNFVGKITKTHEQNEETDNGEENE